MKWANMVASSSKPPIRSACCQTLAGGVNSVPPKTTETRSCASWCIVCSGYMMYQETQLNIRRAEAAHTSTTCP